MPGAAERTINVQHRGVVEELKAMGGGARPPYDGGSAFRFALDRSADRDVADVSAVALDAGVLLRAVQEQTLRPPPVRSLLDVGPVGTGTGPDGDQPDGDDPAVTGVDPSADGGDEPSADGNGDVGHRSGVAGPSAATANGTGFLAGTDSVAGREKVVLGCRALERGWFEEAAQLFLDGAALLPTDPFAWFGAGLAASRFDQVAAADHLARASRYLGPDDPAGAAYTSIVAAALLEEVGDVRAARQLLQRRVEELNITCPVISLHLARLGPVTSGHVADALLVDPLLDVDVTVLGLDPEGESIRQRRQRTEHELSRLAYSAGELRKVGGRAAGPDDDDPADAESAADADRHRIVDHSARFALAGAEIQLWRKIGLCQREIERARLAVEDREAARRDKEREITTVRETAAADLDLDVALPFFASCVMSAAAVTAVTVTARLVAGAAPSWAWFATSSSWLVIVGLLALIGIRFAEVIWPRRNYASAREAKEALPALEWEGSQLRNDEFEARRRFERARQDTELRIRRIIDHRTFVVPRRPSFLPGAVARLVPETDTADR